MKKIIFLATIFAATATVASAQFSYGVKAGLNLASISNFVDLSKAMAAGADNTVGNNKMRPALYAGVFGEWQLSDYFAVGVEALYAGQGDKSSIEGTTEGVDYTGEVKLKSSYLTVPVLAKFYLTEGLSLDLGPQFGFLLSSKTTTSAKVGDAVYKTSEKSKKGMHKTDIAAAVGLTYDFGGFFVQCRYDLGLSQAWKENRGADKKKFKNNAIQLGAGYRF